MRQAIEFWNFSYINRYFVRWTIILNSTNEIIGTVEMFHRIAEDDFNHYGVLRIDLQSKYENQKIIDAILKITNESFYDLFDVKFILIKAFPTAKERVISLKKNGYIQLGKKLIIYDDYFVRTIVYQIVHSPQLNQLRNLLFTPLGIVYIGYLAEKKEARTRFDEKRVYLQEYDPIRKHRAKDKTVIGHYQRVRKPIDNL